MSYQHFEVTVEEYIASVAINRPEKVNALHDEAWMELQAIFESFNSNEDVRVVVLSGNGKHFCAGIDLQLLMSVQQVNSIKCEGRKREQIRGFIKKLQAPINAIEACSKPVIAAVHNGCIGGGVDIVTACDMRYCSDDAYFVIKELDMGMVADIGTLQRLPKVVPYGFAAEMAYTGRKVFGPEAKDKGLVNDSFSDKEAMMTSVMGLAKHIASKSPLSVRGTKEVLKYSRDHSVEDGLNYVSVWNSAYFLSDDLMEAFQATMQRRQAEFK
ncbi:MAG: crotonase/enoyl-CoA hydratase family protein [Bacteroidetes bacterium]|nr:crotonase/enoyl-CoA hydratase family protein [Bacteroidota bacterium]